MDEVKVISEGQKGNNHKVMAFLPNFDQEYNLAKVAGCSYSGTILAFWLLEADKLSENDKKFVLEHKRHWEGKSYVQVVIIM